jgi:hypothetical protein
MVPIPAPVVLAVVRQGAITVDGRLDEAAWGAATPIAVFRQTQPNQGDPATERTEVRIVYDVTAIYVGARMYDSRGTAGVRSRLARRDQQLDLDNSNASPLTSDKLTITLDPYHDHLTRAVFEINPAGVIGDALAAAGTSLDPSWDPIWEAATTVDSLGWTAELRIPLSQLRFAARDSAQTWGLQVVRTIDRLNERDAWAFARKNQDTGPATYGHLTGLQLGRQVRDLEVLPYVSGQTRSYAGFRGDPLNHIRQNQGHGGVDLRYGLGSNLTVDATINPDFGQVEVDPAVINLTAFETFYPEKRPFFVSGAGAFSFGGLNCYFCSNVSSLGLFYSRRIGRRPELGNYYGGNAAYADIPTTTGIVGAAKITGRTESGYTVGVLDAVTDPVSGVVTAGLDSARRTMMVEPLTNYLVARVKRDMGHGATVLGAMATSTVRDITRGLLADSLHRHAEAVGGDLVTTWNSRRYSLMASAALSDVGGSPQSILLTEQSSAHYFQRPDRKPGGGGFFSTRYDSTAVNLAGYAAYARVGKNAGDWLWEVATNLRSPGFEANDLAFMPHADFIWNSANLARQWTVPGSWYRDIFAIVGGQTQHNFEGDQTDRQGQAFLRVDFLDYWGIRTFFVERPTYMDDQWTRGGPVVKHRGYHDASLYVNSDARKWIVLQGQLEALFGTDEYYQELLPQLSALIKPVPNVAITIGPSADLNHTGQQFDTAIANQRLPQFGNTRYVFANLDQTTLSLDTRVAVAFTPTLTLDVYAQPLFASGHYYAFKQFDHPRQLHKSIYGVDVGSIARQANGNYCIDPQGPPASTVPVCNGSSATAGAFAIANPDFNTRELRGNAVLRWEYRPGSTVYFVWQQTRSDDNLYGNVASFGLNRDRGLLFRAPAQDIFSVKVSYWVGR